MKVLPMLFHCRQRVRILSQTDLFKCVGALIDALGPGVAIDLRILDFVHIMYQHTLQRELLYFTTSLLLLLYASPTSPTELFTNNRACVNSPTSIAGSAKIWISRKWKLLRDDMNIKKVKMSDWWFEYMKKMWGFLIQESESVPANISILRKWKGLNENLDVKKVKFFWSGDDFAHLGGLRGFLFFVYLQILINTYVLSWLPLRNEIANNFVRIISLVMVQISFLGGLIPPRFALQKISFWSCGLFSVSAKSC